MDARGCSRVSATGNQNIKFEISLIRITHNDIVINCNQSFGYLIIN